MENNNIIPNFNSLIINEPEDLVEGLELPMSEIKLTLAQMLALGKPTSYIAEQLNKSPAWVRQHKRDLDVLNLVTLIHREAVEAAKSTIISGTTKAAETIVYLVETAPAPVRLAAAKDILDRIGLKAPDKKQIETTVTIQEIPKAERLAAIIARATRLGLMVDREDVIDVEPIESLG